MTRQRSQLVQFLLAVLCFSTVAVQAADAADSGGSPACASPCLVEAISAGYCSFTNITCLCTNQDFQRAATACVLERCTIPEALASKNASATRCGAPIRDRSGSYTVISNTMIIIASLCVLVRFIHKFITKLPLGLDDWFLLATWGFSIASAVITVQGAIANGLGKDIWTLTTEQTNSMLRYFYHMLWMYFVEVTLIKLCFIGFYLRIFPVPAAQRILWGTFVFTALWGTAYAFASVFQCRPVSYFWTNWNGLHQGSCATTVHISLSNSALNIALDIWILAIPLWQIKTLQLHWKKKIGVAFMFCIGTFVTIVSILRLVTIVHLQQNNNPSYDYYDNCVWSTLEVSVGIICACLPSIRLVLIRLFPILGGTSQRSKGNPYYRHDNEPRSLVTIGGVSNRTPAGTVGVVTATTRDSDPEVNVGGISIERMYDVQLSDKASDKAQLIEMNVLPLKQ
ncbi:hypothetical protein B0I35DRAFT_454796 [Stachybotrys elegans]|uniref:CFEM domain-containing protein n=1 Tax=Stachybotrys elegans TaxID=80388 RepID=A0A8K0SIP6_9HYPO|nr:hypothetical protein B0I35DRAFT_454796 [Stachybotrys elegans]